MTKVYRVQLTFDRFDILADLTLAWEGIYTRPDADEEWEATPYHSRDIHLGEEQDPEGPSRVAEMVDLVIDSMGINYYLEPLDRDEVAVDGQTGEDADIDDDKLRKYRNGLIRSITEGQMMRPCKFSFDQEDLVYDGFAHGSTWNGFDNVAVTREVLDKIIADMCGPFNGDETRELFQAIEPMDNGLYSLGWGFTTTIIEEPH